MDKHWNSFIHITNDVFNNDCAREVAVFHRFRLSLQIMVEADSSVQKSLVTLYQPER